MRHIFWLILFSLVAIRVLYHYRAQIKYPNGTTIKITDRVSTEPVRFSNSQYLKISGFKIYLPLYPEISYGDRVVVMGVVEADMLKEASLIKVQVSQGVLYGLRKKMLAIYQQSLPQPHSALVAGVTIGSKADIGEQFWEKLKASGTAHVVVASGMNVTLVASFLIGFLILFLPRKQALYLALIGIWVYAVLAGFDAPIIRAAIMGSLAFVAQELGRLNYAWRALIISATFMLLLVPEWITDIGFLLSFAATSSILAFKHRLAKLLLKLPLVARDDFTTSLAAQVGVTPILYLSFGQFNAASPFINALVLWTVVPMTIIGGIGGLIGLVYKPLGQAVLWLTYPLTSWFVWIIDLMSNF